MNYKQLEYIREGVTMTRGQTFRLDLPEEGLLSGLFLKISAPCTSGATLADELWRLQDHLGLLEVIGNGATIIKSADFKHFDGLAWLKNKNTPLHAWRNYATNTQFEYLLLLFGRHLWDSDYGLDLSKFDNVEFRLTNSSSATYHSSDLTLSIMAAYMREHPGGFRGYIRTEEWRDYATVQNQTDYLVLPSEFPISLVALRLDPDTTSGAADTNPTNQAFDIDFSIGGGTKRVYKGGADDLALVNYYELGAECITGGLADVNADRGIAYGMIRALGFAGISGSKDGAVSAVIPTATADETDSTIRFEAREADSPVHFLAKGYGYQNLVWLWNGDPGQPDTLLDPKGVGETRLNIQVRDAAAAAGGQNQVILERVVSN